MASLQIPLDIPDVEILRFETGLKNEFMLTVKSTKKYTHCRKCGKEIQKIHDYGETVVLRHVSILDRPVYIQIKLVRYKCETCEGNPTTTESPDWFRKKSKHTKAYEEYLMRMLINSTVQDVASKEHESYDCIEGALRRQVQAKVDWDEFLEIPQLGLDEIALKKGHKDFVVIVSARIEDVTKIIAVLPDRKKETVKLFLATMPKALQSTIKTACVDMYDGYINAIKETLGSKVNIIIDRFHVAKGYRKCVDTLRKQELRRLKKELSGDEYHLFKGVMWALRKKESNLTDDDKFILKNIFKYSPTLKNAYNLQNELTNIFNENHNKSQALVEIKQWSVKAKANICFGGFIKTLSKYKNEILNYFYRKGRKNSGFVEGLNNKIKTIKRRCYGIFNITSLYQRIKLDLDGYQIYA
tara:strand:- start:39 stop:1277 length:1239 start_codon:yes stop_codon:yes gene_type:complete